VVVVVVEFVAVVGRGRGGRSATRLAALQGSVAAALDATAPATQLEAPATYRRKKEKKKREKEVGGKKKINAEYSDAQIVCRLYPCFSVVEQADFGEDVHEPFRKKKWLLQCSICTTHRYLTSLYKCKIYQHLQRHEKDTESSKPSSSTPPPKNPMKAQPDRPDSGTPSKGPESLVPVLRLPSFDLFLARAVPLLVAMNGFSVRGTETLLQVLSHYFPEIHPSSRYQMTLRIMVVIVWPFSRASVEMKQEEEEDLDALHDVVLSFLSFFVTELHTTHCVFVPLLTKIFSFSRHWTCFSCTGGGRQATASSQTSHLQVPRTALASPSQRGYLVYCLL